MAALGGDRAGTSPTLTIHGTCVGLNGRGVLILGASGSGKSALALHLMAYGARLVADDRTDLRLENGGIVARCPAPLHGMIEARGLGLLRADPLASCPVTFAVDLDQTETDRLPPLRQITLLGHPLAVVHKVEGSHFPAMIFQYLRTERILV